MFSTIREAFRWRALLICTVLGSTVQGSTLVVDQHSPRASDQNAGTVERPLKTIFAAAARAKPGDRVIIRGGTYREMVSLTVSGTKEHPITFEAAPGEKPIIKGSDRIIDWAPDSGKVWKAQLRSSSVTSPKDKARTLWNTKDVRQVFVRDGILFDAKPLRRVTKRTDMAEGTFFSDPAASLLYVWMPGSVSPTGQTVEAAVRAVWLDLRADHIVLRGLQMRHASTTAIANWPACSLRGKDITMENCTLTWGDFGGLNVNGNGITIRDCLIACNGDSGLNGTGEHNTIEGCRIVDNNVSRYDTQWHAGGAKLIPNFRHGTIRHNEFAHNLGPGLWLDTGCDNNAIDSNVAHDNEGPGIMVEISQGNLVLNNICYANRNPLSGPYRDGNSVIKEEDLSEARIAPSRVLRIYHAGDGRGIYISSAPETKVLNNTCYLNEGEGICVEGPARSIGPVKMTTQNETVANNISVFNKGSQLTLHAGEGSDQLTRSDHNILFAVGAVFAKYGWEGPTAMSILEWQRISRQGAHSIDADPRFAMAAMDDFRVLTNSPAVEAGAPFPEARHDFFEQLRSKEKPTIGACETPAEIYPQPVWQSLSKVIRSAHQ